ncbi:hypothetical protein BJ138DRAFT_639 [Hygrophoropsis aurantiaca]|uniref:Uncharacterized protein n=1 Tax=Hygrophoropsis aurantiaca TaxID=72124 RepID=A0ACB8ATB7_9AGAM|nr:hypothetical protein BJ138DRAFT_639 [Hygrophoropsis aurantiaca]
MVFSCITLIFLLTWMHYLGPSKLWCALDDQFDFRRGCKAFDGAPRWGHMHIVQYSGVIYVHVRLGPKTSPTKSLILCRVPVKTWKATSLERRSLHLSRLLEATTIAGNCIID